MKIVDLLRDQHKSIYRLSKETGIPYSTLNDICNEKTPIGKTSVDIAYKISNSLSVTIEDLIKPEQEPRPDFENFKSSTCHRLKELGVKDFLIEVLKSDEIKNYYSRSWFRECFYLLALTDYLSKENDIPLCDDYDEIRTQKLKETLYPKGIMALYSVSNDKSILKEAKQESIKEFLKYNIVERDIENVI